MSTFRNVLFRIACLALVTSALSAPLANADDYHYGDHMDIAKVISIDVPSPLTCQVVTATMRYIDSSGVTRTVEFRQLAAACSASG
ncbi:hypothetical protein AB7M33_003800 [Pseudomonas sp. Y3 TE3536]